MTENREICIIEKETIRDLAKIDVGNMILFKINEYYVREQIFYIK